MGRASGAFTALFGIDFPKAIYEGSVLGLSARAPKSVYDGGLCKATRDIGLSDTCKWKQHVSGIAAPLLLATRSGVYGRMLLVFGPSWATSTVGHLHRPHRSRSSRLMCLLCEALPLELYYHRPHIIRVLLPVNLRAWSRVEQGRVKSRVRSYENRIRVKSVPQGPSVTAGRQQSTCSGKPPPRYNGLRGSD